MNTTNSEKTAREIELEKALTGVLEIMRYYHKDFTNVGHLDACECPGVCGHCLAVAEALEVLQPTTYEQAKAEADAYYADHPEELERVQKSFKIWWGGINGTPACECGLDDVTPLTCPAHAEGDNGNCIDCGEAL